MRLIQAKVRSTIQRLGRTTKRCASLGLTISKAQPPRVADDLGHLWPLVGGIGEDALDERERASSPAQQFAGAVAILHIGGMNDDAQQQTKRVDEDVALATRDLFARIIALRVKRGAPF